MGETAGDAEWAPPNAGASAGGGSVEVGLDVGCVAFDLQHDVRGEEESWRTGGTGYQWGLGVAKEMGGNEWKLTCGVHREEIVLGQFLLAFE